MKDDAGPGTSGGRTRDAADAMRLRQFTPSGIDAFAAYLRQVRETPSAVPPWDLLTDPSATEVVSPSITLERPGFDTKRDAAEYLHAQLKALPERNILKNAGLWTWLTLYYFDDVCPPVAGQRRVLSDVYYVFSPEDGRKYYRHLLATSYRVLLAAPEHNRLLLNTALSTLGQVTQEVMCRLYLLRIPCIFEVLDRLYYDESKGCAKRGILNQATPRPGDLRHRLPIRIRQLEKTYDLNVLNAEQLLALLGREFAGWVNQASLPGFANRG